MNSKGFTLVESILYMGIFTILLAFLTGIFMASLNVQQEAQTTSNVQQDGSYILSRLAYDVSRADDIIEPASLGGQSSTLQLSIEGGTYVYSLANGNLDFSNGISVNRLNGYDTRIDNIQFTRIGNPGGKHTIQTSFTVQSLTSRVGGFESRQFATTMGLR